MNGAIAARSASPARSLLVTVVITANGAARMNRIPAPNDNKDTDRQRPPMRRKA